MYNFIDLQFLLNLPDATNITVIEILMLSKDASLALYSDIFHIKNWILAENFGVVGLLSNYKLLLTVKRGE